jgi:hypothetical protein
MQTITTEAIPRPDASAVDVTVTGGSMDIIHGAEIEPLVRAVGYEEIAALGLTPDGMQAGAAQPEGDDWRRTFRVFTR